MCLIYMDLDRFEEFDDEMKMLVLDFERNPHRYRDNDDFADLLDFYTSRSDMDMVGKVLDVAEAFFPDSVEVRSHRAIHHLLAGNVNIAKKMLKQLVGECPDEYVVLCALSTYYTHTQNHEENIKCIRKMCSQNPDAVECYEALAEEYRAVNQHDNAIDCYRKCIEFSDGDDDSSLRFYYDRVFECFRNSDNIAEAQVFFSQLIDANPYDYEAWVLLARVYSELSLFEKAVDASEYAIAINDKLVDAYIEKSYALMDLDNLKEATQTLHEVLQKTDDDKDKSVINLALAEKFLRVGNFNTAAVYLRNVIRIEPDCDFAHHDLSYCYCQLGDFISAEKHALKALRLAPDNIAYYLSLGELYNGFAKPEKAETYFKDAIVMEKNNEQAWIAYCEFLLSNDMFEETIQTIEEALHHISDSFETHRVLGTAYFLVGRKKEAYMVIENCCREYGPKMVEAFFECCPAMLSDENILYIVNKLN